MKRKQKNLLIMKDPPSSSEETPKVQNLPSFRYPNQKNKPTSQAITKSISRKKKLRNNNKEIKNTLKKNIMETQTPQQTTSVTPAIQDMQIGNSILTQTQTYVRTYLNEHHHLHPSRPNCNNNKFNFLQIFLQLITYNSSQNFNQVWSIQIAAHPDTTSKLEINIPEHINQPLDKKIPLYPKTYQQ